MTDDTLEFASFDEIRIGDQVSLRRRIRASDVDAFAELSGDDNPLHLDESFAKRAHFQRRVAHGMLSAAYVSALVGTKLPGPGALWTQQSFEFLAPVFVGDEIEFGLEVRHKSSSTRTLVVEVWGRRSERETVLKGQGTIMILESSDSGKDASGEPVRETSLGGRTAVVTGSSRGIGAAIARALGAAGASVVVNFRTREEAARETADAITEAGGEAAIVGADVSIPADVDRLAAQAVERFGRPVSILVNNAAGPLVRESWDELRWENIDKGLRIQLQGAFRCSRAVSPGMVEAGFGRIVNIGSAVTWNVPPRGWTAYSVSKQALLALTRSMAVELGPKGINVNSVSPSMTPTDLVAEIPARTKKVLARQNPLRRLARPEDAANVVLMLCSAAGAYLNGTDIPVSGGSVM